ncbi:unknown [Firmicutes bacterium CAG:137]|nr:unknown [Firmicutes bacterium CAG:137]
MTACMFLWNTQGGELRLKITQIRDFPSLGINFKQDALILFLGLSRSVIIGCPIQQSIVGVHFQRLNVVVEVAIVRHPFGAGDVIQRKGKHHARLIGKAIAVGYRVEVAFPVTGQSIHHNANVTANGAQAFCTAAELINPHQLVAIVDTIKLLVLGIVSQVCELHA